MTPDARWLNMEGNEIKAEPQLGYHITEQLMANRWWPALAYEMEPDHGFLTVYHQLDPSWQLPLNCPTPPLMTLRDADDFGISLGDAIRSYQGLDGSFWWLTAACHTSSASRGSATSTRSSIAGSSRNWASRISASCSTCRTTN
jgi:hypothetical protein